MTARYLVATLLGLLLAVVTGPSTAGAQALPEPVGKVNDFADVLAPAQRAALQDQLEGLERETGAEVALVTLPSLDGRDVDEYANTLFNAWGIGKQGRDNGVLVLVSVQDRRMRIEVGYGLEGILPDGLAGAVMRETFLPRFRSGDYPTGILEGMARVSDIVRRAEPLSAAQLAALNRAAAEAGKTWRWLWFLAIFGSLGGFLTGTAASAKVAVQLIFGLIFTGAALFLSHFVMPTAAVLVLAAIAIAAAGFGFRLAQRPDWRRTMRGTGRGAGGQGWIANGGGSTSSSSSSGSSSSGSSSFGGGRSGGGGASGGW